MLAIPGPITSIASRARPFTSASRSRFPLQCLVATNVAARGLDIPEVDLVVMCHPPESVETYIHRSGRTGRAGREGVCVVFYTLQEAGDLQHISRKSGVAFKRVGAPQPHEVAKASTKDAIKSMEGVHEEAVGTFQVGLRCHVSLLYIIAVIHIYIYTYSPKPKRKAFAQGVADHYHPILDP